MMAKFPNHMSLAELNNLQSTCINKIHQDELYDTRNSAKLRAIKSSKTYDEFKNIVDAAHLKPLNKDDKNTTKTKNLLWNPVTPQS